MYKKQLSWSDVHQIKFGMFVFYKATIVDQLAENNVDFLSNLARM